MKPYYSDDSVCLYLGDCRELLDGMPLRVDHVLTDPPFDAHTQASIRTRGGTRKPHAMPLRWDAMEDYSLVPRLVDVTERWVLAFCALEQLGDYKRAGGTSWVRAGVWHKPDSAPQFSGDRPAQGAEGLAILHRPGRKRWNHHGKRGHWTVPVREREARVHPTQKPLELARQLLLAFTDEGELVFDPFAGSGTMLVAARELGRHAIGVELDERYCEAAARRLSRLPALPRGPAAERSRPASPGVARRERARCSAASS